MNQLRLWIVSTLIGVAQAWFGIGELTAAETQIASDQLRVVLDDEFPRVFSYEVPGKPQILGAIAADRPMIEVNGMPYGPADFQISFRPEKDRASYSINFPQLELTIGILFELRASEIVMKLTDIDERGEFRLTTLNFPKHYLLRIPALHPEAGMYRGEYNRRSWKEPIYRGGYAQTIPRFSKIAEEDGEAAPMRVNWASLHSQGVSATIANNLPYWKLNSQFIGFDGAASDFALWNGAYHYRLRDQVQPLFESRIAILADDKNEDGKVDWMEAALWQCDTFRTPNPIYAGPTFIYKIINAWCPPAPQSDPVTTFEECLPIIQSIAEITGGQPQIVFLVGWQYEGHDSGYPSLDKVNPQLGGIEKLRWLVKEAKKYNATISYHINLDDAYQENPGWDPSVLCHGRDGKPYPWIFYDRPGVGRQSYHISHAKEVESGYFEARAKAFLEAVPVEKVVHLDTFRYSNVSFGPDAYVGMSEELALGCNKIFDWFAQRGIDVSSEGPYDGFYGKLSWFLHRQAMGDPFHVIMMHGKAYGGGTSPGNLPGNLLGWSMDSAYQARPHKINLVYSPADATNMFYLGTLLQGYLEKKKLVFFGHDPQGCVARFEDGTVSRCQPDGTLLVVDGDLTIAAGDHRMVPISPSEIRLYSGSGTTRQWRLPADWKGKSAELVELGANPAPTRKVELPEGRLSITMKAGRPYALRLIAP